MKKRAFLLPFAASLAGFLGVGAKAAPTVPSQPAMTPTVAEVPGTTKQPNTFVLKRATDGRQYAQYHNSHASHASHASHRSHYSSR